MGFYGNITNTSRTQFTFDRTYSSRYEMDAKCSSDGVYSGRYVLVEYETDFSKDIYKQGFYCVDGVMYTQMDSSHGTDSYCGPIESSKVTADNSNISDGDIALIASGHYIANVNTSPRYVKVTNPTLGTFEEKTEADYNNYWANSGTNAPDLSDASSLHAHIVNGKLVNLSTGTTTGVYLCAPAGYSYDVKLGPATHDYETYFMASINSSTGTLSWIQINDSGTNFLVNSNLDYNHYGNSRGYDSTVWQKVYTNTADATTGSPNKGHYEKYVMVAELNTVVPTFDVCADAPTEVPIAPHFDANSTNIYYKFHWQPQWGIRTKAASTGWYGPEIDSHGDIGTVSTVKLTSDTVTYPSDQKTSWKSKFYNSQTDEYLGATEDDPKPLRYYNVKEKDWSGTEVGTDTEFDAAIYYNKAGFLPEKITYSDDILDPNQTESYSKTILDGQWKNEDNIALEPSGLSGHTYNPHTTIVDPTAQEDTQEFSVMLPSLGNSIAKIWDIVYGGRDTNDYIAKTNLRNLDIAWEDAAEAPERFGLRLVNGADGGNGYELTDIEANTLAGCINSVHDLMGMIIVDNSDTLVTDSNVSTIDSDAIYYYPNGKTFKRKHEGFDYTEVKYDYLEETPLVAKDYEPNYYYLDNKGEHIATDAFNADTTYYKKIISTDSVNDQYTPVTLNGYKKGSYYKTLSGEWRYETADMPLEGIKYYDFVSATATELNGAYQPNTVYWKKDTSYILSTEDEANSNRKYFRIDPDESEQVTQNLVVTSLYDSTTGLYDTDKELVYLYTTGRFYYRERNTDTGEETGNLLCENRSIAELEAAGYWDDDGFLKVPILDSMGAQRVDATTGDPLFYQYLIVDAKTQQEKTQIIEEDEYGNLIYKDVITGNVNIHGVYNAKIKKFEENKYFYIEGYENITDEYNNVTSLVAKYSLLTDTVLQYHYSLQFINVENGDTPSFTDYYTIVPHPQGTFYTSGTFWYKTEENNYVIDRSTSITEGREYYETENLIFTPITAVYYLPNKYYIYDEDDGVYVIDNKDTYDGTQHYTRQDFYVLSDTANVYQRGSLWNYTIGTIPATVRIAKRTTKWEMVELEGFARTLNTIHGLILRINNLIDFDDKETRDRRTVQGALNVLNDYIEHLDELNPREIAVVDSYGKLHSASWTTAQEFSTTNLQTSHSSEKNANIYETVDLDKRIYVPYKYYYLDGTNYVLDTSQNFTSGRQYYRKTENRWLYLDVDPNVHRPEIILQHQFNQVADTNTASDKNIALTSAQANGYVGNNNSHSDSIDLYTPIVDATGHVVGKNTETVTLPFGFKILKAQNSSDSGNKWSQSGGATASTGENVTDIVADNTQDSLTVKGGNKWIRLLTDAKTGTNTNSKTTADASNIFTIAHETHDITTASNGTSNLNTESGAADEDNINIPDWTYDIAGHITSKQDHKYTLPYGFKYLTTNGLNTATTDLYTSITAQSGTTAATSSTSISASDLATTADTTQDTLDIQSANKWLQLQLQEKSGVDTLTLAHEIHAVDEVALYTNLNTDITNNNTNETANTHLSSVTGDNITFQDLSFDAAGHVIKNKQHTYTLPYSFKHYSTSATSTTTNADLYTTLNAGTTTEKPSDVKAVPEGSSTLKADQTQDTLTISPVNKWIQIKMSDTNDTISLAHEVHSIDTVDAASTDINTKVNNAIVDTITLQDMSFDTAGHLIANHAHVYTLPYGYKTFKDSETTANSSVANSTQDTFIFKGDSWISPIISNDQLTLTHTGPVTTTHTSVDNVTPAFGSTFSITDLDFDTKGHKANSGSHTVKIPGLELVTATGSEGNVLISLGYAYDTTNSKGVFTQKSEHLGKIALGDYTKPNSLTTAANATISASDFSSTTLLNAAIAALDLRIMTEEKTRADAIDGLDVTGESAIAASQTIKSWSESNGKISIGTQAISIASSQINDLATTYDKDGTVAVTGKSIAAAINDLDVSTVTEALTSTATTFVSEVTESDGKISVKTNILPTASTTVAGIVQLSDSTSSTSTSLAATANAVKAAYDLAGKAVVANAAITAGTATKITYDTKGLVTKGESLTVSDIPDLTASKITDLGTMATESKDDYINTSTEYTYTAAVIGSGTAEAPETPEKKYTFAGLMNHISKLEAAIVALGGTIPED